MKEKILFASSDNNISLALYSEGEITKLSPAENICDFYNVLGQQEIDKIAVYKKTEEELIVSLADNLMIPVISLTEMISNLYATDLLPFDLLNINHSASYLGISYIDDMALLSAQMYQKMRQNQNVAQPFVKTHK